MKTNIRFTSMQKRSDTSMRLVFWFINICVWSGGAKVLVKLSALGRPTNLDTSGARVYCTCDRCG